ncbi:MAG TPA: amidohydrolase family protein [Pirellulales bacterium]|jgi:predicted TIM-barrel fold metal-dependent hydrolase
MCSGAAVDGQKSQQRDSSNRREWLAGAATLAAFVGLSSRSQPASSAEPDSEQPGANKFIDAHVHVWTPDVERYPLGPGFSRADMRPASFTPEELFRQTRPSGVGRVVLIQMSYYGFDNRYMLDAIRRHPGVFSGVAVIDEHAGDVRATLRELRKQHVRGLRIHPGTQAVEPWLFNDDMGRLWDYGAEEQIAMCALVNPEALGPLDRMCQKHPRTTLVIDHFARVGVDGVIREVDLDALCHLARHPQVYVKVSAFYALGKKKAPYTDLAPMIRRLKEAYGRERLMWASDCPFQIENGHTYRDSIDLVLSRLDFLTASDRDWLLKGTAERVFFS